MNYVFPSGILHWGQKCNTSLQSSIIHGKQETHTNPNEQSNNMHDATNVWVPGFRIITVSTYKYWLLTLYFLFALRTLDSYRF